MDKSLKNTIIITLLVFAVSTVWFVSSYSRAAEPASFRSFQVSGEGSVTTIPDVAKFSFGVVTQGGVDLASTQEENTQKVNGTIAFLKEQGVKEEGITTKQYSVEPRYQYYNCYREGNDVCPPAEIVGYTVTQSVQVKVRDFSILGGLLSGVVEKGANTVSQLSFTVDEPTLVQNEARKEAVEKAKTKAAALAEAGGFRVGRLLSIQEGFSAFPQYDYVSLEAGRGGAAPSIEPGSKDIEVSVTLTYEIR
ncbi:MAG: SIMPL domain-containing protein [bacterium]|nr:SIMPL domain-containing protein [bacterium]